VGELAEGDKLVYVNNVIKGKLLESEVLVQQATNNTKEQLANSPDLANGRHLELTSRAEAG
jgi:type I restriction enzyme R subunit